MQIPGQCIKLLRVYMYVCMFVCCALFRFVLLPIANFVLSQSKICSSNPM